MSIPKMLLAVVLLGLAIVLARLLPNMYLFAEVEPVDYGQCAIVPGPVGPEDVTIDEQRKLAFISVDAKREYLKTGHPDNSNMGSIWTLALDAPASNVAAQPMQHDLEGPFHPHGISLFENELYVVNHVSKYDHSVEVFEIVSSTELKLRRSIRFDEMVAPNDLVVFAKDQFFVSNDHAHPRGTIWEKVEVFLTLPWSTVAYFDGSQGHIVVDGLRLANGVALSADQRTLYVAESTRSSLSRYRRGDSMKDWLKYDEINIAAAIDNLEWYGDNILLTGAHSKPIDFLQHSLDPNHPSPSKVVAIDVSGPSMSMQTLLHDDGRLVSGASAAARYGKELFVGVVFDEQLLRCQGN